jgi:hypothetical protein
MAAILESLQRSSINIKSISQTLSDTKKSTSAVNESVGNISRIVATNTRVKRQLFERSNILSSRREEASKRQELEDQIESTRVSSSPKAGLSFSSRSEKGPLERLLGFLGFTFAGWIVENLPTWIFMGQEFISRINSFGRSMYTMVYNMQNIIKYFGDTLGYSLNSILRLDFDEFAGEGTVARSFEELNLAVQDLGTNITDTFKLFTTPLTESLETGEQAPALDEERPDTMFPGVQQETAGSSTRTVAGIHKQALDIIAGPESGGNYNAMNQGTDAQGRILGSGDSKKIIGKALTDMTIGEVIDRQNEAKYPRNARPDRGIHAAGKYQIIGNTLPTAMRQAGLKPSDKFSPENQDLLGLAILKDKGIGAWTAGGSRYSAQETAIIKQAQRTPVAVVTSTKPSAPAKPTEKIPGKTPGYSQAVAFGKSLLSKGYKNIWQHPDFNWNSGYTGSGKERVAPRDYNSYHNYGEALDISAYNGEGKLDALYAELNKNKGKYGIAELLWRTKDHYDHLHISFNKTGATLTSSTPTQVQPAQISAPSKPSQPAAMTPERKGSQVMLIDATQPQVPQVSYPSQQQPSVTPTVSEFKMLNNFIKNKLLIDLAYL